MTREEFIKANGREPKVLQVQMNLVIEGTGGEVKATKTARIHEYDLAAGQWHLRLKAKEIFRDAVYTFEPDRFKENIAPFWDGKFWD